MSEISTEIGYWTGLRLRFAQHIRRLKSSRIPSSRGLRRLPFLFCWYRQNRRLSSISGIGECRALTFSIFRRRGREECYATADALCSILEVITLPDGDRIRGTDMSFEITDGVLHFLDLLQPFCHPA